MHHYFPNYDATAGYFVTKVLTESFIIKLFYEMLSVKKYVFIVKILLKHRFVDPEGSMNRV